MKAFNKRLYSWIKNGINYWIVILPTFTAVILAIFLHNYPSGLNLFRLFGIIIETGGLLTVVVSLSRESKKYDHPGYIKSFFNWMCDIRTVFTSPKTTSLYASLVTSSSSLISAVHTEIQKVNTLEEKVEFLMNKVKDLEKMNNYNSSQIKEVQREISNKIDKINDEVRRDIGTIKNDLKDKATIDFCLLVSGAWLTAIGMIITNLPDYYYFNYFFFYRTMT
jgi:hypothetical protein